MPESKPNRHLTPDEETGVQVPISIQKTSAPDVSELDSHYKAKLIGICIALFLFVTWVFLPATSNDFLKFDDGAFVTNNDHVQKGLSWNNLIWAFRHPVAGNWHPLTVLSHMLDCQLYGVNAWSHHLTNVLVHAANVVLLFLVFQRMTGAFWRCVALAALFGLHPLRVESVAWVAERKDVLSTLFGMLTMLMYARYAQQRKVQSPKSKAAYIWMLVFFICSLLSKPMLVTLPFALLLLDYWPLQRFDFGTGSSNREKILFLVLEKLPLLVLAAACSVVTWLVQRTAGAMATDLSPGVRLANALVSYLRYMGKVLWPENLAVLYPHPRHFPAEQVLGAAVILLVVFCIVALLACRRPYSVVGWLWFFGTLVPVIGLVQVGNQSMADRYSYVPSVGFLVMLVWGVSDLTARWRYRTFVLSAITLTASVLCTVLTRRQISYWKNDEILWGHALAVTKNNNYAHVHLGIALASKEQLDEAIGHFEEAIRIAPGSVDPHLKLGYTLAKQHRLTEAIQQYEAALRLNPADAGAHNDLAMTLIKQGRVDEAIRQFTEALRLKPDFAEVHYNLGLALANREDYRQAVGHFREVLRLKPNDPNARQKLERVLAAEQKLELSTEPYRDALRAHPDDPQAHGDLGRVLLEFGQVEEALEQYAAAARLAPENAQFHYQLGTALTRKGETEAATRQFERVLELDSHFAPAHYALGILCRQQGELPEALKHWREAARLAPQWADPLNNLAWALATASREEWRDGPEAVSLAARAVELSGTNNVGMLDTLAAAYAEAGRFGEAAATARRAEAAAVAQGQVELAGQIRQRLTLYQGNQPYRQARKSR